MSNYKTRLLLACLAVITKRCGTGIVLTDAEVEAALDSHSEVVWERDHRAHSIRLTSPAEGARQ
jgi:hypothetical protein